MSRRRTGASPPHRYAAGCRACQSRLPRPECSTTGSMPICAARLRWVAPSASRAMVRRAIVNCFLCASRTRFLKTIATARKNDTRFWAQTRPKLAFRKGLKPGTGRLRGRQDAQLTPSLLQITGGCSLWDPRLGHRLVYAPRPPPAKQRRRLRLVCAKRVFAAIEKAIGTGSTGRDKSAGTG